MKPNAIALLLGLNGALALGLAAMWVAPDGSLRDTTWTAPEPVKTDYLAMVPTLPGRERVDTSRFLSMLDRPLYSLTRRPPPPPPPPAPPPPVDTLRNARLLGLLMSGPSTGTAILNVDGRNRRVRLKESVEGWTLQSIQGRSATFTNMGESRVLQMQRGNVTAYTGQPLNVAPSAPAASAPAPAPAPAPQPAAAPGMPAPAAPTAPGGAPPAPGSAAAPAAQAGGAPPAAAAPAPARRSRFSMGPG